MAKKRGRPRPVKLLKRVVGLKRSEKLPSQPRLTQILRRILLDLKKKYRPDLDIIFVDKKTICKLNRSFFGKRNPTDVIAFPYGRIRDPRQESPVDEIYICIPVARANARLYGEPVEREITRLVVHGILHLLGYTDTRPGDRKRMWARQEALVKKLCSR